ncbi:MAG: 5'/3'-nucleotidase SurE [Alphaproteobacteria bacterium]|nr:5'/3'-nucleotidase SurE [Alphaproteobacteria bacterium]
MPDPVHDPVEDITNVRILIANDDGVEAHGLRLLERIARTLSRDVWVVAPETEQSGAGHSLTLHRPLRIRPVARRRYAVDGTPTDCVLLAVNKILKDNKPTLVLSGINRGANLGEDVHYSGTVAAAMEGTLLGMRSIAMSQLFKSPQPIKWATAEHWAPEVIRRVARSTWPQNVLINVNFPDVDPEEVTGIEVVTQGKRKIGDHLDERIDPRGRPYIWISGQRNEDRNAAGTDLEAVYRGAVTVTPLCVDLTHRSAMEELEKVCR